MIVNGHTIFEPVASGVNEARSGPNDRYPVVRALFFEPLIVARELLRVIQAHQSNVIRGYGQTSPSRDSSTLHL